MIKRSDFEIERSDDDGEQKIRVTLRLGAMQVVSADGRQDADHAKEAEDEMVAQCLRKIYGDAELAVEGLRRMVIPSLAMGANREEIQAAFQKVTETFHG